MNRKVLFVDDDINILNAYSRIFRKDYDLECIQRPHDGLERISKGDTFGVIVSDYKMPEMNGVEFLSKVREICPDTTRIILTGHADLDVTIQAVNEGSIFRFLVKPCSQELFKKSLNDGLEQFRLITSERELLDKTLKGSINLLTEVLSLVNPTSFSKATRAKKYVVRIVEELSLDDPWQYEVAALLSQVGVVTIPPDILNKVSERISLSDAEKTLLGHHHLTARKLLKNIPRLKEISEIIAYQDKGFDGSGVPKDKIKGHEIPIGARILKPVLDFDKHMLIGFSNAESMELMRKNVNLYDPDILAILDTVVKSERNYVIKSVNAPELRPGMIIAEDIKNKDGILLLNKGQEVTDAMRQRLINYAKTVGVEEPIKVQIPEHFWA